MDWSIFLLGASIALFVRLINSARRPPRKRAIVDPAVPVNPDDSGIQILPRPVPPPRPPYVPVSGVRIPQKTMLQTWRDSIVGLIKLAQKNLKYAETCLARGDYEASVEAAATSTENMSRALLHCYGEKPELDSGQEEALRLLALRFAGKEKEDFENTIVEIIRLYNYGAVQQWFSKHNIDSSFLVTKSSAKQVLASASNISTHFYQIIKEHFASEIPELGKACPKCHTLNITMLTRSATDATYLCGQCGHRWIDLELSSRHTT